MSTHPCTFTASCPACSSDCVWTAVLHVTRDATVPAYTIACAVCDPPEGRDGLVGRLVGLVAT